MAGRPRSRDGARPTSSCEITRALATLALVVGGCGAATVPVAPRPPAPFSLVEAGAGRPDAVVDLGDDTDAALVSARWRHAGVSLVEVEGVDPGPDGRPVPSATSRTLDLSIGPRREGWDAAAWEPLAPHELGARRGHGHVSMGWLRLELVLPEELDGVDVRGATIAFEITADDYGEVWIDGRLPHRVGESGGAVIAGWNAPNRVILTTSAEPGMRFDVAVLVVNGPLSRSPGNFYWVRQAMLDVYGASSAPAGPTEVLHVDTSGPSSELLALDGARVERIATGFVGLGPVLLVPEDGAFLVSDVEGEALYRFAPETGALSAVQTHVRLTALALDAEGRVLGRHADERCVRYERSGAITLIDAGALPETPSPHARVGDEAVLGIAWSGSDAPVLHLTTADSLWRVPPAR
jgi:hypothetical protein